MAHSRCLQHPNAVFVPAARLKMVGLVIDEGWSVTAAAQRFQVDPNTARKWGAVVTAVSLINAMVSWLVVLMAREWGGCYCCEWSAGLQDRSSRPRRSLNAIPEPLRLVVVGFDVGDT